MLSHSLIQIIEAQGLSSRVLNTANSMLTQLVAGGGQQEGCRSDLLAAIAGVQRAASATASQCVACSTSIMSSAIIREHELAQAVLSKMAVSEEPIEVLPTYWPADCLLSC